MSLGHPPDAIPGGEHRNENSGKQQKGRQKRKTTKEISQDSKTGTQHKGTQTKENAKENIGRKANAGTPTQERKQKSNTRKHKHERNNKHANGK